ncbi:hypothetical protein FF011L_34500 [Roseimaritima multifibrata]|uniref:Uncharacterized protein n=1 Tax=Roseimaritima multifibrata TaxID=1930274 RepID=A0A517MII5_9BACT|nr:hypothetical protein FF011L_34500 [Roseimaritima multifibrata]
MRRCLIKRYDAGVWRAATLCDWHCFDGPTGRKKIADRTPSLSRQPDRCGFAICDQWSRDYRHQRVAVFRATDAGRPVDPDKTKVWSISCVSNEIYKLVSRSTQNSTACNRSSRRADDLLPPTRCWSDSSGSFQDAIKKVDLGESIKRCERIMDFWPTGQCDETIDELCVEIAGNTNRLGGEAMTERV